MAKIQFLTILLVFICFLGGVVSVTDKEFEDLSDHVKHLTDLFQNQLVKDNGEANSSNDIIAFYSVLTSYTLIYEGSAAVFNEVLLNEGDGYDSTTGTFTVPSGGEDGYYYFSLSLRVYSGIGTNFEIQINREVLCSAYTDLSESPSTDSVMSSCSGTALVNAGDRVQVIYALGNSETPLWESTDFYYNGFTGCRI